MNTAEMMPSSMDSPPSLSGPQQPGSLPLIDQMPTNQEGEPTSLENEGISPQSIEGLIKEAELWANDLHLEQGIGRRVAASVAEAIDLLPPNAAGAIISTEVKTTVSDTMKSSVSSSIEVTEYAKRQVPSTEEIGGNPIAAIIAAQAVMGPDYYVTEQWLNDKVGDSENIESILEVFDVEYSRYVTEVDLEKSELLLPDRIGIGATTEVSTEDLQNQANQIAGLFVEYDVLGQVAEEIIRDESIELVTEVEQYLALATVEEVEGLDSEQQPSKQPDLKRDTVNLNDSELDISEIDTTVHEQSQGIEGITVDQLNDLVDDNEMVRTLSRVAMIHEKMIHSVGDQTDATDELLDDMLAAAQIVDITDSNGEVTQQVVEQLGISIKDHADMLEVVLVAKTEIRGHFSMSQVESNDLLDSAEELDDLEKTIQEAAVIISVAAKENIVQILDTVGEDEAAQSIIVLTCYYSQILASIDHQIATSAVDDLIDRVNELVLEQAGANKTLINIMAQKEWALAT